MQRPGKVTQALPLASQFLAVSRTVSDGTEAAMKYTKVRFNVKRIVRLYQGGKKVSEIARAVGYPAGHGQNRTRAALVKAGVHKPAK